MTRPLRVLQVIDSLAAGGAERMAVRLANGLVDRVDLSALCATRTGGPLRSEVASDVTYVGLGRDSMLDLAAIRRLRSLVDELDISIVHAHSSSVFFCAAALAPRRGVPALVVHDHNSRLAERRRAVTAFAGRISDAVIAVSDEIAAWNHDAGVPQDKVSVVANFVDQVRVEAPAPDLPGTAGARVVVVANLRPEKNHLRLVRSFMQVASVVPKAHLLIVGATDNAAQSARVRSMIGETGLEDHVTLMGVRSDVQEVLAGCDIAVLPSLDEGFPLALIEYGLAGIAVVATPVGQVPQITDHGQSANLVDPHDEEQLGAALVDLLLDEPRRRELAQRLSATVQARYTAGTVLPQVVGKYQALVGKAYRPGDIDD